MLWGQRIIESITIVANAETMLQKYTLPKVECFLSPFSVSIAKRPLITQTNEIKMWTTTNVRKTLSVDGTGMPKRSVVSSMFAPKYPGVNATAKNETVGCCIFSLRP